MGLNRDFQNIIFIDAIGFSMWPFVRQGQKLLIKKVSLKDLVIGDIILYRINDQMVCHRLIRRSLDAKKSHLYVRGDNSPSAPECITNEMLLGKVVGILKNDTMIDLTKRRYRYINRAIVELAPLLTLFKPLHGIIRKKVRDNK
ncbi:MAG: S24/S26 family peptidase [Candidatus Omnitrophica bacterium]|nr:S24/S26 family peptidase [Candidatus Omnitrophota bacterium]